MNNLFRRNSSGSRRRSSSRTRNSSSGTNRRNQERRRLQERQRREQARRDRHTPDISSQLRSHWERPQRANLTPEQQRQMNELIDETLGNNEERRRQSHERARRRLQNQFQMPSQTEQVFGDLFSDPSILRDENRRRRNSGGQGGSSSGGRAPSIFDNGGYRPVVPPRGRTVVPPRPQGSHGAGSSARPRPRLVCEVPNCNNAFTTHDHLGRHQNNAHRNIDPRTVAPQPGRLRCPQCWTTFSNQHRRIRHQYHNNHF